MSGLKVVLIEILRHLPRRLAAGAFLCFALSLSHGNPEDACPIIGIAVMRLEMVFAGRVETVRPAVVLEEPRGWHEKNPQQNAT